MKVVQLADCRELLDAWNEVRTLIVRGETKGLALCLKQWDDDERIMLAGDYRSDPRGGLKAAMRMSWELTKEEDQLKTG